MQRFTSYEDLEKQHVTVEEREEYEQHLKVGTVVYAGVDYEAILREVTTRVPVLCSRHDLAWFWSSPMNGHLDFGQVC